MTERVERKKKKNKREKVAGEPRRESRLGVFGRRKTRKIVVTTIADLE